MPPLHHQYNMYIEDLLDPLYCLNLNTKPENKKSVTFSEHAEMFFVPTTNEMTPEEKGASYLNEADYERIKHENYQTLQIMHIENPFTISETTYFRGLETCLPSARADRKQRINFVIQNVLKEQARNETIDPTWAEMFANMYTLKTLQAAYHMAVFDAQSACLGL